MSDGDTTWTEFHDNPSKNDADDSVQTKVVHQMIDTDFYRTIPPTWLQTQITQQTEHTPNECCVKPIMQSQSITCQFHVVQPN